MPHKQILAAFHLMFPGNHCSKWWKKGSNAIRLRVRDDPRHDMMFTFFDATNWKLEAVKMFDASKDGI